MVRRYFVLPILVFAAAIATGCGGAISTPIAAQNEVAPAAPATPRDGSWMAPGAAKQQSLLYVTNFAGNNVGVYSYDAGKNLTLVGSPQIPEPSGVCTDKDAHVWVSSQQPREVHEFDRGGTTAIFVIKFGLAGIPAGCAVDPNGGDLAVAVNKPNVKGLGHYGTVFVFPKGLSRGEEYGYPGILYSVGFPAYDNKKHLFISGAVCHGYCYAVPNTPPELFELKKSATHFSKLHLKGVTFNTPTGLAWINPTLLVAENNENSNGKVVGYKMLISGPNATLAQTISFDNASSAGGIAVRAGVAIIADTEAQAVRTYSIANGGPIYSLSKGLSSPSAVAVSQAPAKSALGVSK